MKKPEITKVEKRKIVRLKTPLLAQKFDKFIEYIDNYVDGLSEDQIMKMSDFLGNMLAGQAVITGMICKGPECPYVDVCVYTPDKSWPLGKPCPKEILERLSRIKRLCEKLNINIDDGIDPVDFRTVLEVVDLEIEIDRMKAEMAKTGLVVDETSIKDGYMITTKKAHPLLKPYNNLLQRKHALLDSLLATRRASLDATAKAYAVVAGQKKEVLENKYEDADKLKKELLDDVVDVEISEDDYD